MENSNSTVTIDDLLKKKIMAMAEREMRTYENQIAYMLTKDFEKYVAENDLIYYSRTESFTPPKASSPKRGRGIISKGVSP